MNVILLVALVFIAPLSTLAAKSGKDQMKATNVVVYKSPTCGCCVKWEEHLKAAGFKVESKAILTMDQKKRELGVPQKLQSCHTAIVDGYVIEGHVPATSIKKLLQSKAKVKGLSVPGMPMGSPGMEGPRVEKYNVISFTGDGKESVFDRY